MLLEEMLLTDPWKKYWKKAVWLHMLKVKLQNHFDPLFFIYENVEMMELV